jgi:hypothetical protein
MTVSKLFTDDNTYELEGSGMWFVEGELELVEHVIKEEIKEMPLSMFKLGDRVVHDKYGLGTVRSIAKVWENDDNVGVEFDNAHENLHNGNHNGFSCPDNHGYYVHNYELKPVIDFEIGDRVKHKEYGYGIIREKCSYDENTFGVEFDTYNKHFHDLGTYGTSCEDGHGWYVNSDKLELVNTEFKVGDKITHKEYGIGTIKSVNAGSNPPIGVEFDKEKGIFHTGGTYMNCKENHGWFCKESELSLVSNDNKNKTYKIGDRVYDKVYGFGTVVLIDDKDERVGIRFDISKCYFHNFNLWKEDGKPAHVCKDRQGWWLQNYSEGLFHAPLKIGDTVVISAVGGYNGYVGEITNIKSNHLFEVKDSNWGHWFEADDLTAIKPVIIPKGVSIKTDNKHTVIALKSGCKNATAKCNPEDVFDLQDGIDLAVKRLSPPKHKLVSNFSGSDYGVIGGKTVLHDIDGRELYVGDLVDVKDSGTYPVVLYDNEYFIMGFSGYMNSMSNFHLVKPFRLVTPSDLKDYFTIEEV